MVADVYNTTINVNGNRMFSSSFSLGNCCCCNGGMFMNSCFGFGYGGFGGGLGMGVGYAAGLALTPLMPAIFTGIGKGFSWLGTKVIAPAGKAVGKAAAWVGKGVWKGISSVGKAIGSIFHKKSKSKNV